jgi:hypothetical protein
MSLPDFSVLTPEQFNVVYLAWFRRDESLLRDGWERTRFIAVALLQPHSKKRIKPTDLVVFPWEEEQQEKQVPESTKERFTEALKRWS